MTSAAVGLKCQIEDEAKCFLIEVSSSRTTILLIFWSKNNNKKKVCKNSYNQGKNHNQHCCNIPYTESPSSLCRV